jgi:hypothetical protein
MSWSLAGAALALVVAAVAWRRSRSTGGFHDRETYGMGARAHRRYAAIGLAFAAFFVATYLARAETAGVYGLALYALIAVFYATSFLQGAPDRYD